MPDQYDTETDKTDTDSYIDGNISAYYCIPLSEDDIISELRKLELFNDRPV